MIIITIITISTFKESINIFSTVPLAADLRTTYICQVTGGASS